MINNFISYRNLEKKWNGTLSNYTCMTEPMLRKNGLKRPWSTMVPTE